MTRPVTMTWWSILYSVSLTTGCVVGTDEPAAAVEEKKPAPPTTTIKNDVQFPNPTGAAATFSTTGNVDETGPFFQSLGSNGRSCGSCHQIGDGWTITPPNIQARFTATDGMDPLFSTVDGATSPTADVSTLAARQSAYSMLLTKGLIRIGIGIPAGAEFTLAAVDDPYGYASTSELSLFRRPLPTTNMGFLSTVMWDGRETLAGTDHCNHTNEGGKCFASLNPADFDDQSNTATLTHAQGAIALTPAQEAEIVAFETALFTAQVVDNDAQDLTAKHARGGPDNLAHVTFAYGANDNLGDYQSGAPFTSVIFTEYSSWNNVSGGGTEAARASIARGEQLFNTLPITISDVPGLTTASPFVPPLPTTFTGTCGTCHDTPSSGNHSIVAPLNIGLTDASRRTPDMPLYTLRNTSTGATVQTTDPGRALITGKWADVGKFKGPILRGLAARPPYFHNGFAQDLDAVIDFYNDRFAMDLTQQQHDDLVAFLRAL
jgi:cytochrome c peroxidase